LNNVGPVQRQKVWQASGWAIAFMCGIALGWWSAMGCAQKRNDLDPRLMSQALRTIDRNYVERNALHQRDMTYGAIGGIVDSLGDTGHTTFLTPEMVKDFKRIQKGEFTGIGVEIQVKDGHVVIVAPMDGSPAQKAGLVPGDRIVKLFGEDVSRWQINQVVEKVTGPPGTPVMLTIEDPKTSKLRDVRIVRAAIKIHEVSWHELPGTTIAHLRIAAFQRSTTKDLRAALKTIQDQHMSGVILDLRNNPGGLLDEAVHVASQFLSGGNVLEVKEADGSITATPVESGGVAKTIPMVVLINQGTASAAEIVAGALSGGHRAKLVGETTFGTGTVLSQFPLYDGSALLLAVQEWLTPDGRSFWHKGISPDINVTLAADQSPLLPSLERELTADDLRSTKDVQLVRALDVLTEKQPVAQKPEKSVESTTRAQ